MSLKMRDIEELFRKHGAEQGARKAILLLSETVIAQQEALMDCARIIDVQSGIIEQISGATEALISSHSTVRKRLGLDIDESDVSAEPINDIGSGGKEH